MFGIVILNMKPSVKNIECLVISLDGSEQGGKSVRALKKISFFCQTRFCENSNPKLKRTFANIEMVEKQTFLEISKPTYKGAKWVKEQYGTSSSALRSWANKGKTLCLYENK